MTSDYNFSYVESDIPLGMTHDEWRRINRPAPRPSLFRRITRRGAR